MKSIPPQDEMQILALLVQNKPHAEIAQQFDISIKTVGEVKKRNPDTLAVLEENLQTHRLSQASSILDKANKAIEKRLDESESFETQLAKLQQQYADGELEERVYKTRLAKLQRLNIAELTAISREMHSQSKTEAGGDKPSLNPVETQAYLVDLAKGLEAGDEVVLERLIFKKTDE